MREAHEPGSFIHTQSKEVVSMENKRKVLFDKDLFIPNPIEKTTMESRRGALDRPDSFLSQKQLVIFMKFVLNSLQKLNSFYIPIVSTIEVQGAVEKRVMLFIVPVEL